MLEILGCVYLWPPPGKMMYYMEITKMPLRDIFHDSFILLTQQTFIEQLLCVKHCVRC